MNQDRQLGFPNGKQVWLFWLLLFVLISIVVAWQTLWLGVHKDIGTGILYTSYNNYLIFKHSFFHLIDQVSLYQLYPKEHFDYYKYSPSFALLFGVFSYLPNALGVFLWTILNAIALLAAIYYLPIAHKEKWVVLIAILPELLISLQNMQSNALLTALVLGGFILLERKKSFWAALFFVLAGFIKLYGGLGFILFLFYPNRFRFLLHCALFTVVIFLLPLLATIWDKLIWQYQEWAHLLKMDEQNSIGLSLSGVLHFFIGKAWKTQVLFLGLLLLLLKTIAVYKNNTLASRFSYVLLLLIWLVIFNHKAESPTYILAMVGIAFLIMQWQSDKIALSLLSLAVVLTSLTPGDLFPKSINEQALGEAMIKAWASIVVYCIACIGLIKESFRKHQEGGITF